MAGINLGELRSLGSHPVEIRRSDFLLAVPRPMTRMNSRRLIRLISFAGGLMISPFSNLYDGPIGQQRITTIDKSNRDIAFRGSIR